MQRLHARLLLQGGLVDARAVWRTTVERHAQARAMSPWVMPSPLFAWQVPRRHLLQPHGSLERRAVHTRARQLLGATRQRAARAVPAHGVLLPRRIRRSGTRGGRDLAPGLEANHPGDRRLDGDGGGGDGSDVDDRQHVASRV